MSYTNDMMKKKPKRKLNKSELKVPTKWLNEMLKRAATPLSEEEARKEGSQTSDDCTSKRTRQHKAEDAED